jgi:hypothetical protein
MVIWISLAAVVVVIIVICLLALHFLRAEDADPFDEIPDEPRRSTRQPEDDRQPALAGAGAPRPSRPAEARPDRPARSDRRHPAEDRAAYRDRAPQPPHDRPVNGSAGVRPPAAPPRSAPSSRKSSRSSDPATTDWESLSDVDYWAELAADKSQPADVAAAAAPAPAAPPRRRSAGAPPPVSRDSRPDARSPEPRPAGRGEPGRGEPGRGEPGRGEPRRGESVPGLPVRSRPSRPAPTGGRPSEPGSGTRPAPGRYNPAPGDAATESIAALARLGSTRPPSVPPSSAPPSGPMPSGPRTGSRPAPVPAPLDDDPLTSPSFPAISTSDSRSYRTRRHDSRPGHARPAASYSEPPQPPYSAPERVSSPPNGYPVQSPPPAGNPYGSFVSQPPAPTYPQQAPAASPMPAPYPDYGSQPAQPDPGWYGTHPPVNGTGQTQAMPALSSAQNGYQYGPGHDQTAGYYNGYQAPAPEGLGYTYPPPQYDEPVYNGHETPYGRDPNEPYPGYGQSGY